MSVKNAKVNAMKIGAHEILGEVCTFGFGSSVKKGVPVTGVLLYRRMQSCSMDDFTRMLQHLFRQRWVSITIYKAAQSSLHFYTGFKGLFTYLD